MSFFRLQDEEIMKIIQVKDCPVCENYRVVCSDCEPAAIFKFKLVLNYIAHVGKFVNGKWFVQNSEPLKRKDTWTRTVWTSGICFDFISYELNTNSNFQVCMVLLNYNNEYYDELLNFILHPIPVFQTRSPISSPKRLILLSPLSCSTKK